MSRVFALLSTTLMGCSSLQGVWLMELKTTPDSTVVCDSTISENLVDYDVAQSGEGGGAYTSTYAYSGSSFLFFVEIVETGEGATMAAADVILPGTRMDSGAWKFSWNFYDAEQHDVVHDGGYQLYESYTDENIITFELKPDGDEAVGDYTTENVETELQHETDTWPDEVADEIGTYGDINTWVVSSDAPGNRYDSADCSNDICEIKVEQTCTLHTRIRATRTDADDLGDFAALQDFMNAGQFTTSQSYNGGFDTWNGWDTGFMVADEPRLLRPLILDPLRALTQDGATGMDSADGD